MEWRNKLDKFLKNNKQFISKNEVRFYKSLLTRKKVYYQYGWLWNSGARIYMRLYPNTEDKLSKMLTKEILREIDKEILKRSLNKNNE